MTNPDLDERLASMEEAMRGDMKGNAGMIQNLIRLMNDMYQEPRGMQPRLSKVEEWQMRKDERANGMSIVVRIIWIVSAFSIGILAHHFWK